MSIIDDIKADRKAGTGGDWRLAKVGRTTISETSVEGDRFVCTTGGYADGKPKTPIENAVNARRIARVPQLEAIVLAADLFDQAFEDFERSGCQSSVANLMRVRGIYQKLKEAAQ